MASILSRLSRGPILAVASIASFASIANALDISAVENVIAQLGDTSCKLELMALGMSFVNAHGCVTTSNSWEDLNRCGDKVFDFLITGGYVYASSHTNKGKKKLVCI